MAQALVMVEIKGRTLDFERIESQLRSVPLGSMGAKQVVHSVIGFGDGAVALLHIGSDEVEGMGRAILEFAKVPKVISVIPVKVLSAGN